MLFANELRKITDDTNNAGKQMVWTTLNGYIATTLEAEMKKEAEKGNNEVVFDPYKPIAKNYRKYVDELHYNIIDLLKFYNFEVFYRQMERTYLIRW